MGRFVLGLRVLGGCGQTADAPPAPERGAAPAMQEHELVRYPSGTTFGRMNWARAPQTVSWTVTVP